MSVSFAKVTYVLSQFPETHETFILREILEMERQGVSVEIISLKKCRDKVIQTAALRLKERTHYVTASVWLSAILLTGKYFLKHPVKFMRIFRTLVRDNKKHPGYLIKTLGLLPIGVYAGQKSRQWGARKIHAHWATVPAETAWVASRVSGIPFSFTAHAWDIFLHPGNLERLIDDADKVITCTKFNKSYMNDQFGRNFGNKIVVTYHGLDFSGIVPKNGAISTEFRALAIGRLVEQKGFSDLLRAVAYLKKKGFRVTVWLVGDGPLREELKKMARDLDIEDRVEFKGMLLQQEVFSLMRRADVLVMPSVVAKNNDRDGIPNVILEAMAHRLPVIGTRVSGLPEVIIDHVTGLLVRPGAPEELAEAIEWLITNSAETQSMVEQAGHLLSENFDIHKNVFRMRKELRLI
ncbi:MAG: glycosyltransferase family 4 protein [Calditrichaeota bacterium]|nr:glycosyltransferase family 4 protein [Calditrichota bacterium]